MRVVLCPRCELNYITGNEEYCKVCLSELRGTLQAEEPDLCSVCNLNPVLPGRDICEACLREMSENTDVDTEEVEDRSANAEEIAQMDSIAQMDDILPDVKSDDGKEYGSVENPLSLEDVREDEDEDSDGMDEESDER